MLLAKGCNYDWCRFKSIATMSIHMSVRCRPVVVYIHQNALLTIDIDLSCYTHINSLMQLNVVIHTWMTWGLSLLFDRTAISKG